MKISVVTPEQAVDVWEHVEPYVQSVVDITYGRATAAETLNRVLRNEATLWVVYTPDDLAIKGFILTKVNDYAAVRMLTVEMLAGDDFDEWIDQANNSLVIFAQHFNCAGMELIGRQGWEKKLKRLHWEKKFITCQLMFEEPNGKRFGEFDSPNSDGSQ